MSARPAPRSADTSTMAADRTKFLTTPHRILDSSQSRAEFLHRPRTIRDPMQVNVRARSITGLRRRNGARSPGCMSRSGSL